MSTDYNKLSKEVSYVLRHTPWEYELELDKNGWVSINQLLTALHQNIEWKTLDSHDLKIMIEQSEKKRHEIREDNIRALYGHSVPIKIEKTIAIPPKTLYHGTSLNFMESIKSIGLLPMSRQYVHLSEDIETATIVGKRKDSNPIILAINTELARENGVNFYLGNDKVWLTDKVLPEYIDRY